MGEFTVATGELLGKSRVHAARWRLASTERLAAGRVHAWRRRHLGLSGLGLREMYSGLIPRRKNGRQTGISRIRRGKRQNRQK